MTNILLIWSKTTQSCVSIFYKMKKAINVDYKEQIKQRIQLI